MIKDHTTAVIAICISVVIILIFILVLFYISFHKTQPGSTTSASGQPITTTNSSLINKYSPIVSDKIQYYLLCIWYNGTIFNKATIAANNSKSTNGFGGMYFYDKLVNSMLTELGQNVQVGSYVQFSLFPNNNYFCSQNTVSNVINKPKVTCLMNSSDTTAYNVQNTDLDYLDSTYVSGGIIVPKKMINSQPTNTYTLPSYMSQLAWNPSFKYYNLSIDNSNPNTCIYLPKFILLMTNGNTAFDTAMTSQGYYVNSGTWDSTFTAGTIAISNSFFPPV